MCYFYWAQKNRPKAVSGFLLVNRNEYPVMEWLDILVHVY